MNKATHQNMKQYMTTRLLTCAAVLALMLNLSPSAGAAGKPPAYMTYTGYLVDGNGTPLGNAAPQNFDVVFSIFDAETSGNKVWAELQTVTVDKGNFSILLGEGSAEGGPWPALDNIFNGSDRFIEVTVKNLGGSDQTILPRLRFLSAPYAFSATHATSLMSPTVGAAISVNGPLQSSGGDARGTDSVDLQVIRGANNQVAAGQKSVVGGGENNRAGGNHSLVSGGVANTADGAGSTVGGGASNTASGQDATVAGGLNNIASGLRATVGGGEWNLASQNVTTVGGGVRNQATVSGATIAGGAFNLGAGQDSFIGGGLNNTNSGVQGTISGGLRNKVTLGYGTVGGGVDNTASGEKATVSGGELNIGSGEKSTVGGGIVNWATAHISTVSGGWDNHATIDGATVGGGMHNRSWAVRSTVGGGDGNVANGATSTVAGGYQNHAGPGANSTVGGGHRNHATNVNAVVTGGADNRAYGVSSFIGGGYTNRATALEAVVGGGAVNQATADRATVAGGLENQATGVQSAVGGGHGNVAGGLNSAVLGGYANTASGRASVAMGRRAKATHDGSFVFADNWDYDCLSAGVNTVKFRTGRMHIETIVGANNIFSDNIVMSRLDNSANLATSEWTLGISGTTEADPVLRNALVFKHNNVIKTMMNTSGGHLHHFSDRRLKKNIKPAENILERAKSLSLVNYDFKNAEADAPRNLGMIAQEVKEAFPELVAQGNDMLTLNYSGLGAVAIGAIKELDDEKDKEISKLKQENDALKTQMADILKRLQALESAAGN